MLVRELTSAEAADPRKRQQVAFWNIAHAMEHSLDCRLAIWRGARPSWINEGSPATQPVVVFGWPGRSKPEFVVVSLNTLRRNPDLLGAGKAEDVVLARESLGKPMLEHLEQRYGYSPAIEGQDNGHWFYQLKAIPRTQPSWRSTAALLAAPTGAQRSRRVRDDADCLLLVDVDDQWLVLSTTALRVYQFGAALDDKEPVYFVQWIGGHRVVWRLELAAPIAHSTVRSRFGAEAAQRAKPSAKSIVVRCRREPES